MEKSGSQKALKVVSIILIVLGAIVAVLGLLAMAGGAVLGVGAGSNALSDDAMAVGAAGAIAGIAGLVFILSGAVQIVIGAFGVRGANDPSKVGVFWVLCIIGIVLEALGLIGTIANGGDLLSPVISLALVIVCFVLANNVKKESQQQLPPQQF